ncbi:MAG: ATP-dependent DNA ligase, partial [Acidimicrobiales bacterium]
MTAGDGELTLELDGHEVTISSPSKVFFSKRGETKLDLVEFYRDVRDPLLAAMGGRPVLLQRFPEGAEGSSFFHKRVPASKPAWLRTADVSTPNGTISNALVAADVAHVAWAVNLGCLGFHVWPTRADDPD